jgi:hypothetical protein
MNLNNIDFCERMEIGKQVAMDRRNKGLQARRRLGR